MVRFQTPEVKKLLDERERMKELKVAGRDLAILLASSLSTGNSNNGTIKSARRDSGHFLKKLPAIIPSLGIARINWQSLASSAAKALLQVLIVSSDCLNGLAEVSTAPGYVRPQFFSSNDSSDGLDIEGGRHPMLEKLRTDPFVPNSIALGGVRTYHDDDLPKLTLFRSRLIQSIR